MSTQYLTLVNSVLRRLREDEVSAVANTTYSKMVGDFVNDAKRQVENSHDWSALRTTVVVTTSSGTSEYSLTGAVNVLKYTVLLTTLLIILSLIRPQHGSIMQSIILGPLAVSLLTLHTQE